MKKNMLLLNTVRGVKKSPGRFVAILAIIAISCAFYAGVKAASADLKNLGWKYYREYAFHAARETYFKLADLGNDAGMYGCVRMILD